MKYFIAYSTEDTLLGLDGPLSEEEVLKRLEEKYYGDIPLLDHLPKTDNMWYKNGGILIIKGSIQVPKPTEVVLKYEFPKL